MLVYVELVPLHRGGDSTVGFSELLNVWQDGVNLATRHVQKIVI